MDNRFICIHGHFYQPPRENPWLEEVEVQDSAYPYRDWNDRINAECYSPNTAARIQSGEGKVLDILNNYTKMSFNFGPTLLSWMKDHAPDTYQSILQADIESRELYSGHGSAIAQVYNHMIMPLSNTRDKRTQVVWGIEDFKSRFGRDPEGMWLAETAVDNETLEVLAENGIKFTILAPRQAARVKAIESDNEWTDVSDASIDPKMAYLCKLPSGRSINLFFYDGPISQELAFGDLLKDGANLANRLAGTFRDDESPQLVNIATDGETYGHHSKHGDMALAYCLNYIETNNLGKITIYGEFLEKFPPKMEVQIIENTSWSCIHGIERWRSNCGCNSGRPGWNQNWRAPLREALDWLRDTMAPIYEKGIAQFTEAPWDLRDDYIKIILDRSPENLEKFFSKYSHNGNGLNEDEKTKILKYLEMQRHAMLMYTSCGWFFDEISGIETVQVIMYAGRAIQLLNELGGPDLEQEFIRRLESTVSNIPEVVNGAHAYLSYVKPAMIDLLRVTAHYAISTLFENYIEDTSIFCYEVFNEKFDTIEAGKQKMVTGRARMRSKITYEIVQVTYAVITLGDQNIYGGVRESISDEAYEKMKSEMTEAFNKFNIIEIIFTMDKNFGNHNYSLWHLFKDESRKVFDIILKKTLEEVEFSFRQIYENHYSLMQAIINTRLPLPKAISTAVEYVLNTDISKILKNPDPIDREKLYRLADEAKKWSVNLDRDMLGYIASRRITALIERISEDPTNSDLIEEASATVRTLNGLGISLNLWKGQNILYYIAKEHLDTMRTKAKRGTQYAKKWVESLHSLEDSMQLKLS
ncbi:MAG: DUF3536 domain-containing protein [Bacteroidota bacterium]|nr:DUF3536 domain-containing protein [Bacteroidota bacterium]MDP4191306.1 DUF3536 domain-containing protein [Bacteroidota bacterium]MDP4195175.1 DUF3536 domain-containing protein [Bacteroidota bacterium]